MTKEKKQIEIICTACKHKSKPTKWWTRIIIGIIMFPFAIFPAILYFVFSNPYYCPKCHRRNKLVGVVDKKETKIKALPRWIFILIALLLLIILAALAFMSAAINSIESGMI